MWNCLICHPIVICRKLLEVLTLRRIAVFLNSVMAASRATASAVVHNCSHWPPYRQPLQPIPLRQALLVYLHLHVALASKLSQWNYPTKTLLTFLLSFILPTHQSPCPRPHQCQMSIVNREAAYMFSNGSFSWSFLYIDVFQSKSTFIMSEY